MLVKYYQEPKTYYAGHTSGINELRRITECICLNYSVVYECSIDGDGFTLWRGSAFDCIESSNEINLAHNMQGDEGSCNNGNIVARSIPTNSTAYVSQLTILDFNLVLNGRSINCSHGNGETLNIGTEVIMISGTYCVEFAQLDILYLINSYIRMSGRPKLSRRSLIYSWIQGVSSLRSLTPCAYSALPSMSCQHYRARAHPK